MTLSRGIQDEAVFKGTRYSWKRVHRDRIERNRKSITVDSHNSVPFTRDPYIVPKH